jgi:type IV secretory pathway protease TraF
MIRSTLKQVLIVLGLSLAAATCLVVIIVIKPIPRLIWNVSESVPTGPYFVKMRQPDLDEIAVIRPADWVRLYASSRGYLPDNVWLLKPIVAMRDSLVCRFGKYIFVNGKLVAKAKIWDRKHRLLPIWQGCRTLKSDEVFVLARPQYSFDSRYFGPVNRNQIVGTAIPLTYISK